MSDTSKGDEVNKLPLKDGFAAGNVIFLKDKLKYHIDHFQEKRNYNRRAAHFAQIATIISGGTITILLGIKPTISAYLEACASGVALLLSASVTAIAAWEGFADYKWKWVRYRSTLYVLYTIRDDLEYKIACAGKLTIAQVDEFYERIGLAVKETNEQWVSQRMKGLGAGNVQADPAAAEHKNEPARARPSSPLTSPP
jgi:hypothetical protein